MNEKVKKRMLGIALAMTLLVVNLFNESTTMNVHAANYGGLTQKVTETGLKYYSDNKKVVIYGYEGKSEVVDIPSTIDGLPVKNIAEDAFKNNKTITTLVVGNNVESIGDRAFEGCINLKNVSISEATKYIGVYAFSDTSFLKNYKGTYLILGDGILCKYNGSGTEITIPDGIKVIADYVFESKNIATVHLPDTLEIIGQGAFSMCWQLEHIAIPNGVKKIEYGAFYSSGLKEVNIPESVTFIGEDVFYCNRLGTINVSENNLFYKSIDNVLYNKNGTNLICYPQNKRDESFSVPNGVKVLKPRSFMENNYLKNIKLPDSLIKIGAECFEGCIKIGNIVIPEGVTYIGEHAFSCCYDLTDIYLPETVTSIGHTLSEDISPLYHVIAGSVAELYVKDNKYRYDVQGTVLAGKTYSKYNGSGTEFELINGDEPYTSIGRTAFQLADNLLKVVLPDTIEYIGNYAFHCCRNLKELYIGEGVKVISEYAFSCAYQLEEVNIPESVLVIGDFAFGCTSVKSINIPSKVSTLGEGIFWRCSKLEGVVLSEGILEIGDRCFEDCTMLSYIYIPETVTDIAENSFENCYFVVINAPKDSYAIEYAKEHNLRYVEISKNTNDEGFSAEINKDIIDEIDAGESLPIASEGTKVIFENEAVIEIQHNHGNKDVLFQYNVVDKAELNGEQQISAANASKLLSFDLIDQNGDKILFSSEEKEGIVTITVPYKAPVKANIVKVFYISPSGERTDMEGVYDPKEKTITFSTTHFSVFAIENYDENNKPVLEGEGAVGPVITTQPEAVTATEGKYATFIVVADGTGLSYQWQYSQDKGTTWKNSGATSGVTATYSLGAKASRNGYLIRCIVKDANGQTATSSAVKLTVKPVGPAITTQPKAVTAVEGKYATFKVAATGTGLTYQWQYSQDKGTTWKNSGAASGVTATYSLGAKASRNGYLIRCIVTDANGQAVTSEAVKMTVKPAGPVITTQPEAVTATEGKYATFKVATTGTGLSYQWQYSQDNGSIWKNSGAASGVTATYSLGAKASRNGYLIRCVVTDANGQTITSEAVQLTVTK